jgi:rhamnose transport system permease protein
VTSARRLAARLVARWETLLVVAIVGVGVWSTALSPFFLTRANLLDLVTQYAYIGLMAFGLAFVVIAGEIDISVVSNLAVSVVCFAQLFAAGVDVWLAAVAGLGIATVLGFANGILVGILNLPSLAVTLGTLAAYQGLAFVVLSGEGVASFPSSYTQIGGGYLAGNQLPVALLVLLGFALALGVLLHATRFGRYLFTIGSNREAARFSGIPVARVRVTVFAFSGLMAGFAGIAYVGFFGSARADAGQGQLLDVVTVVVLGGVDIFGGVGSMLGVFLALVLVAELRNGMATANIAGDTQDIVIGGLLLAAIVAGNLLRAAQSGGIRPKWLPSRRREVIGDDASGPVNASNLELQKLKGKVN